MLRLLILPIMLLIGFASWSQKKSSPQMVQVEEKFEGVAVQPSEALEIATPYLEEHATDHWNPDKPLLTHIILKGNYYYISRTNYPAKTVNYYLQPAVKVNTRSGEVSFVKKDTKKKKN